MEVVIIYLFSNDVPHKFITPLVLFQMHATFKHYFSQRMFIDESAIDHIASGVASRIYEDTFL